MICQGVPNFLGRGESHAAKLLATSGVARRLLGEFGAMLPRNFFLYSAILWRFVAYFHKFFT